MAVVVLTVLGLWRLGRWFFTGPRPPDPWDAQVTADLETEEVKPLCHRCLAPHEPGVYFCPGCGAPVGMYTNWLPFPYIFSLGHVLRQGASGDFRRTPITLGGFWLLSLAEYTVLAPVYWYRLYRSQRQPQRTTPTPEPLEGPVPPEPLPR